MTVKTTDSLRYADAGVDIDAGNALVERIKPIAKQTLRPEVLTGLGGFGGLFALPINKYQEPVLVSGTDGVGTKLKLAIAANKHNTVGIDLVAMCVNDLIVCGAEPLFFLDYYATGALSVDQGEAIIAGIGEGCKQAGAALIGGETAEMPGMYAKGDYDLAGFCVGIVEKQQMITGEHVQAGDVLIGIRSSGPHANGYSLIRHVLELTQTDIHASFGDSTFAEVLLTPTKIYVQSLLSLFPQVQVKALCHITGGGFIENLPRVLPAHCQAELDGQAWPRHDIFTWLQDAGNISQDEMYRTFNCGIGMVLCVAAADVEATIRHLTNSGESAYQIGTIHNRDKQSPAVVIR